MPARLLLRPRGPDAVVASCTETGDVAGHEHGIGVRQCRGTARSGFALAFDANTATIGDQAFAFIGAAAFTPGTRGQLRHEQQVDGNTQLFGDIDGDAVANFEVVLAGTATLTSTNFIL